MERANIFGDVRAEQDHEMLDNSFHEWQDYRTLFESNDRFIVVGRRGTGKSALTYRLEKDWRDRKFSTLVVAPTEEQVIGLRPVASLFGSSVTHIRAGIKLAWRYALLIEIASLISNNYKVKNEVSQLSFLNRHLTVWRTKGEGPFERLRATLRERLRGIDNHEDRIADLPSLLELSQLQEEVSTLVISYGKKIVILIDRLDEGYEPDTVGVGIVDGLIYGTDEVRNFFKDKVQALIFLRDNIFRAIQIEDRDFSRNLEGQVLRLHWDPEELFYMVTKRIRKAFAIEKESDIRVWNAITAEELHGRESFKRCLKQTLYRPRDVISLLNTALYQAKHQNRETLIGADFVASAKQISTTRFDDLGKEYESVFPGIKQLTSAFANGSTRLPVEQASIVIQRVIDNPEIDQKALQHIKILGTNSDIIKALYGVGFFGMLDEQSNNWVFSHDGKQPDKTIANNSLLMIHPCYWSALNLKKEELEQSAAEQIYDEYEITIFSQSSEQRGKLLGQLISELNNISNGLEDAHLFEDWCKRTIEIAFAKELTNIQLHPNGNGVQRRDIVATNQGISGFWKRVREDYETRQVIFEVKNFETIGIDEYRQMNGYLTKEYGRLGFIICRDKQPELVKGRELEAFKEFYSQGKVIIKITAAMLTSILSKLRSPAKVEAGDFVFDKHLDNHIRLYSTGQTGKKIRGRDKSLK